MVRGLIAAVELAGMLASLYARQFGVNYRDASRFLGLLYYRAVEEVTLNSYFLSQRAQTIGKVITHIQIVNYDDGLPAPLRRTVLLRYLPMVVAGLIPVAGLLVILDPWFIFRADHRCLHDHTAGTVVVKLR